MAIVALLRRHPGQWRQSIPETFGHPARLGELAACYQTIPELADIGLQACTRTGLEMLAPSVTWWPTPETVGTGLWPCSPICTCTTTGAAPSATGRPSPRSVTVLEHDVPGSEQIVRRHSPSQPICCVTCGFRLRPARSQFACHARPTELGLRESFRRAGSLRYDRSAVVFDAGFLMRPVRVQTLLRRLHHLVTGDGTRIGDGEVARTGCSDVMRTLLATGCISPGQGRARLQRNRHTLPDACPKRNHLQALLDYPSMRRAYLPHPPSVSLGDIASKLGYADVTALRAFRRWSNASGRRQQQRHFGADGDARTLL